MLDLCRKHGISDPTFHNSKAKYAGMTLAELRQLREFETAKLKRIIADQQLDISALKGHLGRNWSPQARREAVGVLTAERGLGVTRAGALVGISPAVWLRDLPCAGARAQGGIAELAAQKRRYGYRRIAERRMLPSRRHRTRAGRWIRN